MCCIPILAPLSNRVAELFILRVSLGAVEVKLTGVINPQNAYFELNSIQEWAKVGEIVLAHIDYYKVILLIGNLGAGKTTFVQKMSEMLQINDEVTSPTYSIIQEYRTEENEAVYHLDLYRLNDYEELVGAGVEDIVFMGEYKCIFIEWPELIREALDIPYILIDIEGSEGERRTVSVSYNEG